ncbi:hypothetical protein BC829DRAFT_415701 [Chytridium lagenaria]|nr:hypothetical protein BC829DRAFT_415701 [Chytridium lagenaria]
MSAWAGNPLCSAAVCCLNDGKCNLAEYCGVPLVDKIEDLGETHWRENMYRKVLRPFVNLKLSAQTSPALSGMLCCPSTNQCDFAFNCEGIPPVKIPDSALIAKTECQGLPAGSRICSEDGFRSLCVTAVAESRLRELVNITFVARIPVGVPGKTRLVRTLAVVSLTAILCVEPQTRISCIDELPSNESPPAFTGNTDNTICVPRQRVVLG